LNAALQHALQLARHDYLVIVISDFSGNDAQTRDLMLELRRRNDMLSVLVYDPFLLNLPDSGHLVVSDGELQVELGFGRETERDSPLRGRSQCVAGRVAQRDWRAAAPGIGSRGYGAATAPAAGIPCRCVAAARQGIGRSFGLDVQSRSPQLAVMTAKHNWRIPAEKASSVWVNIWVNVWAMPLSLRFSISVWAITANCGYTRLQFPMTMPAFRTLHPHAPHSHVRPCPFRRIAP
jgi:hypothetical protein